jgi:multidrug efflux pump subunit AcrA (membrane-fusion protein)
LVALTDGGYGVMKAGDSPTYTRVQTGRFSGALVEITGGDLQPGDQVVVTP